MTNRCLGKVEVRVTVIAWVGVIYAYNLKSLIETRCTRVPIYAG